MKEYTLRRRYLCTILGSSIPQLVEADYQVRETDDGLTVEQMIAGSLNIVNKEEWGNA